MTDVQAVEVRVVFGGASTDVVSGAEITGPTESGTGGQTGAAAAPAGGQDAGAAPSGPPGMLSDPALSASSGMATDGGAAPTVPSGPVVTPSAPADGSGSTSYPQGGGQDGGTAPESPRPDNQNGDQ